MATSSVYHPLSTSLLLHVSAFIVKQRQRKALITPCVQRVLVVLEAFSAGANNCRRTPTNRNRRCGTVPSGSPA